MSKCPVQKKFVVHLLCTLFLLESVWELYKSLLALAPKEMSDSLHDWHKGKDMILIIYGFGFETCICNIM